MPIAMTIEEPTEAAPQHSASPGDAASPFVRMPSGRLQDPAVPEGERTYATILHLSLLSGVVLGPFAVIAPLVMWLARREQSPFVDDHGRDSLNFALSMMLYNVVLGITFVGVALLPVLWIVTLVSLVRAAVAAGKAEYFRYPITIRFIGS